MKKKYTWVLLFSALLLISCYDDDSELVESTNATHRSSELTSLIKSMTLHNASFDDHIDKTSCYSLVFPYTLSVNSTIKTIASIQDVNSIDENDQIEILYPASIVYFDYNQFEVNSPTELRLLTNNCEDNFILDYNACLDFEYPIVVNEFNELNATFETITIDSNKKAFEYVSALHDSDVYEIEYPITLLDHNFNPTVINSNAEFISAFDTSVNSCL
jgi:hypothetical protein